MDLHTSIELLPHTSALTIRKLKNMDILTYHDLLNYFPFRYDFFQQIVPIGSVQEGETVTIIGTVTKSQFVVLPTGKRMQKFSFQDETGTISASWFNQPYLLTLFKPGTTLSISGTVKKFGKTIVINPVDYELIPHAFSKSSFTSILKHTGRIVPVYSEKFGISSKTIREKIWYVLHENGSLYNEYLPGKIISYHDLISESVAYRTIHFPDTKEQVTQARKRLGFDELFLIQLKSFLVRKEWKKENFGSPFSFSKHKQLLDSFVAQLPFQLTQSQSIAINEIISDLGKINPMNRFLQGEVGSGKTVVATYVSYVCFLNGFKTLFMAPTEILAQQHFQTICSLFGSKSSNLRKPNICLVTSSSKTLKAEIDKADIMIGTHALIQKKYEYKNIGLVIIDEQHRFGVSQRAELKNKGLHPHLLTMTATPIPRTVMLTLYGELDISILHEMPKNRLAVKTYFVPEYKRNSGYAWIQNQIVKDKTQAFIVCPFIETSQSETLSSVKAAKMEFEILKKKFPKLKLGLLHGKSSSNEKKDIMEQFKNKSFDILVTTPVVEVGVDIPNATIMLIEGAERYGLAQLHQLRGRVGRGNKQAYCFVFTTDTTPQITERLRYFCINQNGADLAEKDLKIRGPGNFFGTQQHGYVNLKIARLDDVDLITQTKKAAKYFMANYSMDDYPELKKRIEENMIKQVARD